MHKLTFFPPTAVNYYAARNLHLADVLPLGRLLYQTSSQPFSHVSSSMTCLMKKAKEYSLRSSLDTRHIRSWRYVRNHPRCARGCRACSVVSVGPSSCRQPLHAALFRSVRLTSEMHIVPRRERISAGAGNWSLSIKRISCQQVLMSKSTSTVRSSG